MSAPVLVMPAPALTVKRARLILEHPRFGDPGHIEARELLELASEVRHARDLWGYLTGELDPGERPVERMSREQLDAELSEFREIGYGEDWGAS